MDIRLDEYCADSFSTLPELRALGQPWDIVADVQGILEKVVLRLDDSEYRRTENICIHKTAVVEQGAVIKGPAVIGPRAFVGAHAYLRGGVYLGESSIIGPSAEVKSTIIFSNSSISHLSFVGDSIIGSHIDIEAGAVLANHHNDRADKTISVTLNGVSTPIVPKKFGALVGDYSCIGANAVTAPGTILPQRSIVGRLTYHHV